MRARRRLAALRRPRRRLRSRGRRRRGAGRHRSGSAASSGRCRSPPPSCPPRCPRTAASESIARRCRAACTRMLAPARRSRAMSSAPASVAPPVMPVKMPSRRASSRDSRNGIGAFDRNDLVDEPGLDGKSSASLANEIGRPALHQDAAGTKDDCRWRCRPRPWAARCRCQHWRVVRLADTIFVSTCRRDAVRARRPSPCRRCPQPVTK